ncbi:bifunctional DNA primase/polymerase [Arthrobacter sp. H41]|uniref:bifunctional DNA primase/polymerase n=1 Tax=Arthrobacter sp. H41 TaxID=1312978 RepID=UPI0004B860F6|nr:bifunctional DNA primase/polymerase [Arthrobacter sp. H41]
MTATLPGVDTIHAVALEALANGLSIVPVRADGSKAPAGNWRQYQERQSTLSEVDQWFPAGSPLGLGIVTGYAGVEMTETEAAAAHHMQGLQDLAAASGLGDVWARACGWVEQSPSGGYHLIYRISGGEVAGNTKLAKDAAGLVLAETRGRGGMVIIAPSGGSVHPSGGYWQRISGGPDTMGTLSTDEADQVHDLFRTLDATPPSSSPSIFATRASTPPGGTAADGLTPGDDYEARTDWADILTPAGWTHAHTDGPGIRYWTRPGKKAGVSATTGKDPARDRLYVFSSSTDLPAGESLTKFHVYAHLHHGGDHSAAASLLRKDGYGKNCTAGPAAGSELGASEAVTPLLAPKKPPVAPMTLDQTHQVYRQWLGDDYDTEALDAVLAAAACDQLDGDPLWLLLLSGSGNAKTETVQALEGSGATITSTISSVGALLSATSTKEKTKDATGGLLRKLGGTGVLVIKDVTSILSMDRTARGEVLGAFREIHDGRWSRNVGTDGGRTLEWEGRLIVIGAVTTAWDRAHDVIASMGDRFVIVRMDSTKGRQAAGRQAIGNTGQEVQMRRELEAAASGALANIDQAKAPAHLTPQETEILLEAANIVTLARTGVDYDYRGDVIDAHAPEMPTRFAKELAQVVRGGIALGMNRLDALRLAIRCARDSMPPLRLAILDDVAGNPYAATKDVRKRLGKPRATVDRQLQALHMLGILTVDEETIMHRGQDSIQWRYTVTEDIDPRAINANSVPDLL